MVFVVANVFGVVVLQQLLILRKGREVLKEVSSAGRQLACLHALSMVLKAFYRSATAIMKWLLLRLILVLPLLFQWILRIGRARDKGKMAHATSWKTLCIHLSRCLAPRDCGSFLAGGGGIALLLFHSDEALQGGLLTAEEGYVDSCRELRVDLRKFMSQ